jgi:hypothetical protein
MTKTKPEEATGRLAVYPKDVFLVRLLSSLTQETHGEVVARLLRKQVRKELSARDVDPDKAWADASKRQ